jgi:hypothetical protein
MDAGKTAGMLTTRAVRFRGRHCFVNIDAPKGELRVEMLDRDGKVIPPFTRVNCMPIRADRTAQRVQWKGAADLNAITGQTVKFRFHITHGKLYSFWVSPDASGASHGYIAAGGPGLNGLTDTVGVGRRG